MGFPRVNNAVGVATDKAWVPSAMRKPIPPGRSKRVWWKPNFGLFTSQNKFLPTAWIPLTFEYTLQGGENWCDTTAVANPAEGAGTGEIPATIPGSTSHELRNCYLYYDVMTLDSGLHSNYADLVKRGRGLNIAYESALLQTMSVLSNNVSLHFLCNLARVSCFFATFNADGDAKQSRLQSDVPSPASLWVANV